MGKIDLYLVRVIFLSTLSVFLVVFGIYFVITFISNIKFGGYGDLGVLENIELTLYSVPFSLNIIMPIIAMFGTLIGLSSLVQSGEMVAMRASGVSWFSISKPIFFLGVLFAICSFVVGSYISPKLNMISMRKESLYKKGGGIYIGPQELWLKDKNNFFYIKEVGPGYHGVLNGINKYTIKNNKMISFLKADKAILKDNNWELFNVYSVKLNKNNFQKKRYAKLKLKTFISLNIIKLLSDSSYLKDMTLYGIYLVINYRSSHGLNISKYQLEFWQIIFQPISIIVLMFSILPYIFMATSRTSYAFRMFVGSIVGFCFFVFNQFFSKVFIIYNLSIPAFLIAALPCVVFSFVTFLIIKIKKNM